MTRFLIERATTTTTVSSSKKQKSTPKRRATTSSSALCACGDVRLWLDQVSGAKTKQKQNKNKNNNKTTTDGGILKTFHSRACAQLTVKD